MATRKRKPWNADRPDLFKPAPPPKPLPHVPVTPGTSSLMGDMRGEAFECGRCELVRLGCDPGGLDHSPRCPKRAPETGG